MSNLQVYWILGDYSGNTTLATGNGNAPPAAGGNGNFWGDAPSFSSSVVPGTFQLYVNTYSATLTLYNNSGQIVLPPTTFSGWAPYSLSGPYNGTWAAPAS